MTTEQLQTQLDALRKAHEDLSRRLALVAPTKAEKAQLADLEAQIGEAIRGLNSAEMEALKAKQRERDFKPAYAWQTDEAAELAKVLKTEIKPLQDAGVGLAWVGIHDVPGSAYLSTRFPAAVRERLYKYSVTARAYADAIGRHRRNQFHRDETFARLWGEPCVSD